MKAYFAFIFAKQQDSKAFLTEVATAIKSVAETKFKYAEGAAAITTIAFICDKDRSELIKAFKDFWRPEQRVWIFSAEDGMMVDAKIMEWIRDNC